MRVSIIDVGKGDCILLQNEGSNVLIDTGYKNTTKTVLGHMQQHDVNKLDALVITHFDQDHVGGLQELSHALGIAALYLPGYAGADKNYFDTMRVVESFCLAPRVVKETEQIMLGKAVLKLHPSDVRYVPNAKGDEGNDNDTSLVATLTLGDDSYLFAGDLEDDGIRAYLRANHGSFDVLKMPHHGERDNMTQALVEAVNPQLAVITDSRSDPADKKTCKLLEKRSIETYRSAIDGTIVIESDGSGCYTVETELG